MLFTGIIEAEYWQRYLLGYLGHRITCVSYWDNWCRELAVLVTGIIGAEY